MTHRTLLRPVLLALVAITCFAPLAMAASADQNAALRYWRVFAVIGEDDMSLINVDSERYEPERNHAPEGEPVVTSAELLERHADSIELLMEAAAIPACDFEVDYHHGVEALLPHLSPARRSCQLLILDAQRLMAAGKPDEAVRRVAAAYQLAQHLTGDVTLINSLVSIACFALIDDFVEKHEPAFNADQRKTISRALARFDQADPFGCAKAVRGEATYFGGWMLRRVDNEWSTPEGFIEDLGLFFDDETAGSLRADIFTSQFTDGATFQDQLRREIEKYHTALHLMADAWNTPDAEKSLDAIEAQIVDGGFGPGAQVMAPALGRCYSSDMKARTTLKARLEWARN